MLDEEDFGFTGPEWAPGEYEAYINSTAEWFKSKKLVAKLSNGKIVWFCSTYEQRVFGDIIERVDESEYLVRKLAGTLNTEYVSTEWEHLR